MPSVQVGDATLYVRAKLRPGRPTVAFIHALGATSAIFDEVVELLAGRDIGALSYDLRGHGLSDLGTPPRRIADHAADLAAILDALGIASAAVCGVSVGGQIALGLAEADPRRVERLALCCTGAKIGAFESWNERIAAVEAGGVAALAEGVLQRWFAAADYARGGGVVALARNMLIRTPSAGYIATCAALRDSDLTEAAKRVKTPTLVVAGGHDGSTPPDFARALAALVPGAALALIGEAGHLPPLQTPEAFARLIGDFVGG